MLGDGKQFDSPIKKSAEKLEKEPMEISPEFLMSFFSGKKFETLLRLTSAKARRSNDTFEFGFKVLKDPFSEKAYYGKVVGGNEIEAVTLKESINKIREKLTEEHKNHAYFVDLHFHPNYQSYLEDTTIIPSGTPKGDGQGDLISTNKERVIEVYKRDVSEMGRLNTPPMELIAVNIRKIGKIKILAYREPVEFDPCSLKDSFQQMCETLEEASTQEDVINALKELKYVVEILWADSNGKLDEESLKKLVAFAYTPTKEEPSE